MLGCQSSSSASSTHSGLPIVWLYCTGHAWYVYCIIIQVICPYASHMHHVCMFHSFPLRFVNAQRQLQTYKHDTPEQYYDTNIPKHTQTYTRTVLHITLVPNYYMPHYGPVRRQPVAASILTHDANQTCTTLQMEQLLGHQLCWLALPH